MLNMFTEKPLTLFIEQPQDILQACHNGPIEITGNDHSYVVMTTEYLQRIIKDMHLADHLDKILARLKKDGGISEERVMGILNNV